MPKINDAGLALIKEFEGLRLEAYLCPARIWTIGYGHTHGVKKGQKITKEKAEEYLKEDLKYFEDGVQKLIKVAIPPNAFSAIVSFAFNLGCQALADSTLLKLLNNKEFSKAANQFLRWNKVDGEELEGLARRRKAERALFLT